MSMKRLAILSAVGHSGGLNVTYTILGSNMTTSPGGRPGGNGSIHGNVNVLLGGAMLSGVILVVVFVCYCCHRNISKNTTPYSNYWREPEVPLEVFTLAAQAQCYESAGLFLATEMEPPQRPPTPGPPPAYDAVIAAEKDKLAGELEENGAAPDQTLLKLAKSHATTPGGGGGGVGTTTAALVDLPSDETGLPSYEAALRLEAGGYV